MNLNLDDTIAALASPPGPAARGIIRISGPESKHRLDRLFEADGQQKWANATAAWRHTGTLRLKELTVPVPAAVYFWPGHRSYTGQSAAELHLAGSPPILEAVLAFLFAAGVRPARAGEFTLRAFLAGRVDLVQAEAVLGVIDAADSEELENALRQLAGGISTEIAGVRDDLLNLLADLEAGLDFVEEDIEFVQRTDVIARINNARDALQRLLEQASNRSQSSTRLRVVLAGLPNAGKSTLFNALVGENAAIVSEIRGTTRDYLSAQFEHGGLSIELIDTAGWEEAQDEIVQQAQTLRGEQFDRADLIVWCTAFDCGEAGSRADVELRNRLEERQRPLLCVTTKCDLAADAGSSGPPAVSGQTGQGLSALLDAVTESLSQSRTGGRQFVGSITARCRESLASAADSLNRALHAAEAKSGDEVLAVDLRESLDDLGRILGDVYSDDILDRIFSKFCIGK